MASSNPRDYMRADDGKGQPRLNTDLEDIYQRWDQNVPADELQVHAEMVRFVLREAPTCEKELCNALILLRRAYKRTSLKTHPDKAGGHKALFVEVTRAYAVLSDKQLHRDYDLCCSGADAPDFEKALALIKASKRPLTLHLVRPVA